ncbi:MAG: transposase, partial [Frankiaceae bacterium]
MPAQRKYPEELRERAVKMVLEIRAREGKGRGELARMGRQLGVHPEALRDWVRQAEIDGGTRPGVTTGDAARISELEREVRELRRANEIGTCPEAAGRRLAGSARWSGAGRGSRSRAADGGSAARRRAAGTG